MKIDVHIHSRISPCSTLSINEIIHTAAEIGLDGICITDHNSIEIRHFISEGLQKNGLLVIFGMEYDTPEGDFLLFGPYENLKHGLNAAELLDYVSETGGASIAAHPFRNERPVSSEILFTKNFNSVETINGRNTDYENKTAENWACFNKFSGCGGSDAHSIIEIGSAYTDFAIPVKTREDLIFAIKNELTLSACNQNYSLLKTSS